MEITINGEPKQVPASLTLRGLVGFLELKGDGIAVELNRRIVPRDQWDATSLRNDDRLEIVQFVGGG